MKILGTPLANAILADLKTRIETLEIQPHLAIIVATHNPAPKMYISIKTRKANEIGLKTTIHEFSQAEPEACLNKIITLNHTSNVHGILMQLPVYEGWNENELVNAVTPEKDVDGFLSNSKFQPATGLAVWEMLSEFAQKAGYHTTEEFLKSKHIVVLGKGRTAGKPSIDMLKIHSIEPTIIDSKTPNADELIRSADVIISAVGKKNLINGDNIKEGSYIIGIGVGKETHEGHERIFGDIAEESIKDKAAMYCPTIGGIGPLTVACLLRNVVEATSNVSK